MVFQSKRNDIYRELNHKLSDYMRAWKQLSNTITATSGRWMSRVTVVNIHDVKSRGRNTEMEYQCSSLCCSISILAHECYNFIFKGLIDQVILYSQRCTRK